MPRVSFQRSGGYRQQKWKQKPITGMPSSSLEGASSSIPDAVTEKFSGLSIAENSGQSSVTSIEFGSIQVANQGPTQRQKLKSYGTVSGATCAEMGNVAAENTAATILRNASREGTAKKSSMSLSKIIRGNLLENFTADNLTYSLAEIRATFYPEFEDEQSDQEIRTKMIEVVTKGLGTVEVSLKHSGSLFMYTGHKGGAYAKNSFGNVYTAVGVFVLGRMFHEAWGVEARKKQAEFNDFLEEMIRLMVDKRFSAAFKCYHNFHKIDSISNDNLFYKMVIHVHGDSVFRQYQKEMRHKPGLWPLYRGFFVDINLFKANKERAAEIAKNKDMGKAVSGNGGLSGIDGLADDDANLMIKMKFLTYKLRTLLIRNGLSTLFKDGPAAYKAYYLRQMNIWGTSAGKQRLLSKMLDEWAVYIRRKYRNKQLSSSIYLSEAEPFLEHYARRSPGNQALIGSAGNLVMSEEFLAIVEGGSARPSVKDAIQKDQGLIVFFPGIPGCAKSALCKELLNAPGGLGDGRPVHSLMGDLIKGRYWQKVADEHRREPFSVMLADKHAPNEEVWRQIEDICRSTKASAVPVVPDSEGTDSNPFSLDALSVFMFRVIQRVNHPGNLDKNSPNAGYVLLMFYHLYEGKSRKEFEAELVERFGSVIKMPLLKNDRCPLPDHVRSVLEEGINLYKLHSNRHGRLESTKGLYAKEWVKWEKQLRETLFSNADYLYSVQLPFESRVNQVLEQLRLIAKGEYKAPSSEKWKFGTIVFAAVSLPVTEIRSLLDNLAGKEPSVDILFKDTDMEHDLKEAHITLAHKGSHGVTAVANYGPYIHRDILVELTALLFTDKMAALQAQLGSVDDEKIVSRNQWPHVTLWTGEGVAPKEANALPQLHSEGKATRIEINPPFTIQGTLEFY